MNDEREEEQKMRRRRTAGAMLMCATFVLIAAAPLVSSEETVHTILKDENGPPSTCALDWDFTAPSNGVWYAHVENYGMRWLILDMIDLNNGDVLIDREMYRYAVTGDTFDTPEIPVVDGHTYAIKGTPNGPLWTYVTVEDKFVPDVVLEPPVAMFEVTVDGLMVSVDASGSFDPDGGDIVEYMWEWGDGSSDTGMTATHTYVPPPGAVATLASSSPALGIELPHPITGHCYDSVGNVLVGCEVTVTDVTLGYSGIAEWDGDMYSYDIANLPGEWAPGDAILVEAVMGSLSGSASGLASDGWFDVIDVVLEGSGPEPFEMTITLTVTDDDGQSTSVTATVELQP
jgi:hypothetical protein